MASLTFANVETRVANRLRLPTSNTTEMTKLDAVINDVYRMIASKYDWHWLDDRQLVTTSDDITTGTLSVTGASTAVTFSSAPTPSVAGRVLSVTGNATEPATFRITSHTAGGTAATLESAYTGATNTAAAYTVWADRYDLASDTGKLKVVRRYGSTTPVAIIGMQEMERLKQFSTAVGAPQVVAVYGYSTEGDPTTVRRLHVYPYPDNTYKLDVWDRQTLNTEAAGTTRMLIPDDWLHVLEWGCLAYGYPIFHNDTERGLLFERRFLDALNLMVARLREHEDPILAQPLDQHRRFYRAKSRVSAANADLGAYFDRWPLGR